MVCLSLYEMSRVGKSTTETERSVGCQEQGEARWGGMVMGESESEATQSCPTLCDPTDCSPWNFPGKSTGTGCHFLLQRTFPTQGSNLGLPLCRQRLCFSEGWKYFEVDCGGGTPLRMYHHPDTQF